MKTLVLITDVFPYGSITENAFISPEIKALAEQFDKVIIAPRMKLTEEMEITGFPENIEVCDSLILNKSLRNKLKSLPHVLKGILNDLFLKKGNLRDIVAYSAYVDISRRDLKCFLREKKLDPASTLFYTFWFDFTTAALSLENDLKFLTRVHGHDLYEERNFISSYWRKLTFEKILKCYTVSEAGKEYLSKKYPDYADKIQLANLGTENTHGSIPFPKDPWVLSTVNKSLEKHEISLLGIARLSPEKGVTRQIKSIVELAERNTSLKFHYLHIGDGPLMENIIELTRQLPENLSVDLLGAVPNADVHTLLTSRSFDMMILLSHSEGLPVSLCEAISYGIPYLATDVGGIHEIIPRKIIPLLNEDYTFGDFEHLFFKILGDSSLREKVRAIWESNFDSRKLRNNFAKEIRGFLPS